MKSQALIWISQIWRSAKGSPRFVVALIALGLGIIGLLGGFYSGIKKNSCQISTLNSNDESRQSVDSAPPLTSSSSGQIVVDVSGGVKNPGIYELTPDARIFSALEKAGGLTATADLSYIQQHLNLAEKLQEGEKIYFPLIQTETDTSCSGATSIQGSNNLISLNFASATELDSLPGLGEKLSAKIIAGRPYSALDELVSRIKISQSVFDKIKAQLEL